MACSSSSLLPCSSSSPLFACSSPSRRSYLYPKSFNVCAFRQLNSVRNGSSNLHLRLPSRNFPSSTRISCLREYKASTVTGKTWENLVLKNDCPVLVEFYASWCGPCQMVHRVIDEIAAEYKGKIQCLMLNTDSDLGIAEEYEIKAVPVVLIFKDGKKEGSVVGTMPKEFYVAAIDKALAS